MKTPSPAERRAAALLALLAAVGLAGCDTRDRPAPAQPDAAVQLSVEVLSPRDGAMVVAGRALTTRVAQGRAIVVARCEPPQPCG